MVDTCFVISRLFLTVICLSPMTSSTVQNISIAVLLPKYHTNFTTITLLKQQGLKIPWPYFLEMVSPGMDIAHEKMEKRFPGINITITFHNSYCRGTDSMIAAVTIKDSVANDAFFGPACEFAAAPVARFVPVWNKVLITAGALSTGYDFDDQEIDKSFLTRIHGSYTKFARFLLQLCQEYSWSHVALIYEEYHNRFYNERKDCYQCLGAVNSVLVENNFTIAVDNFKINQANFRTIVEKLITVTRGE